jgi:hypothetical protein
MEETQKTIDWGKEVANLEKKERIDYWKVPVGESELVFLDNGTDVKNKDFEGKDCAKRRFLIQVNRVTYQWDVFKHYPDKKPPMESLYGQIAIMASKQGGLSGFKSKLVRKGTGKKTNYTIISLGGGQ